MCCAAIGPRGCRKICGSTTTPGPQYSLAALPAEPGVEPPRAVVSQQLDSLLASGKVKCLLTYGSLGGAAFVPSLLREKGRADIKVIQGVWLDDYNGNNAPNDAQIGECSSCRHWQHADLQQPEPVTVFYSEYTGSNFKLNCPDAPSPYAPASLQRRASRWPTRTATS